MNIEAELALQEHERLRAEVASLRATISQYDLLLALPASKSVMEELERLRVEVTEHRAARGIGAPAGWRRSDEGWERPGGPVVLDEEGVEQCPAGWLHVWEGRSTSWKWAVSNQGGTVQRAGTEATCLAALAAAEAVLAGGGA